VSLIVDIKKKLADFTLEVSFVADNGRLGILGESGSGKSMTLKCVADEGRIVIDGETVFDSAARIDVPSRLRGCGYLFQNYALFPHLTVEENIAIAARTAGRGRDRVADLVRNFALDGLEKRKPARISGGQQQRLALARMLAAEPRIICLDEPFSALDSTVKTRVEEELDEHLSDFSGTILFVSHNRDEAYRFCENLVIVDRGSVAEAGTLERIFSSPRTVAAARLTGCRNIAPALRTGAREIFVPDWNLNIETTSPVPIDLTHAGIHAHHIRAASGAHAGNTFAFRVARVTPGPFSVTEHLEPVSGGRVVLLREVPAETAQAADTGTDPSCTIRYLRLPPENILLLRR